MKRKMIELWLRPDVKHMWFPRDYMNGKCGRKVIMEYEKYMGGTDRYMNVFSYIQQQLNIYDTLWFDIDGYKKESYEKWKILKRLIYDFGYDITRVYFTGNGIHAYIDFPPTNFNNYRGAVRRFADEIGLKGFFDCPVSGDVNRLMRIPGSLNSKTALWMIEIHPDWTWVEIEDRSRKNMPYENDNWKRIDIVSHLKEYDEDEKVYDRVVFDTMVDKGISYVDEYFADGNEDKFPSCIKSFINEIKTTGNLDHYQRLNLAIFLLHVWGYDKCVAFFREFASDYDERTTSYQLKYIIRRKLKMYSCKRMENDGFCMWRRDCPFKPSLNSWVMFK